MRPAPAAALFAAMGAAALLAEHWISVAVTAAVLLAVCLAASGGRRRVLYLTGAVLTALSVFLLTPFVETIGSHPIWTGPTIPVVGTLDVTREELAGGAVAALRLLAVSLAFAAGYAPFRGKIRYRIPVVPLVMVLAGAGLSALGGVVRARGRAGS